MINALACQIHSLAAIDEYCTKTIEPLLLKANGQPVYFGKYNESGTTEYYISAIYAKDTPSLHAISQMTVSPKDIRSYLEALGYKVSWVQIKDPYPAGFSSSRRTCYYPAGYNVYYSLKIEC